MTTLERIRAALVLCAAATISSSATANDKGTVKVTPHVSGVIVTLGSENKPLAVGESVANDQIIAVLDDRLARIDLQVKEGMLSAATADRAASQALHEEAKAILMQNELLFKQGAITREGFTASQMAVKKLAHQVVAKEMKIHLAKLELDRAKLILEMHGLRSPVAGEVRAIFKTRGEGVKALESVVQIKAAK